MKHLYLLIATAILGLALTAQAFPTLSGPTGLGNIPTADIVPKGLFGGAATFYNIKDSGTGTKDAIPIGVLYGAAENVEVGAAYWLQGDNNGWTVNGKYLLPLQVLDTNLTVGAQYLDFTDSKAKVTQVYLLGTRPFTEGSDSVPAIRGTLGLNYTNLDAGGSKTSGFRGLIGVDATFANKLTLGVDFQTKKKGFETKSAYSVVARYPFTPVLVGQIGFSNGPIFGGDKAKAFAGVLYVFKGPDGN